MLKKYRNQIWAHRKQIKFIAEKQYYACRETQLWVATKNHKIILKIIRQLKSLKFEKKRYYFQPLVFGGSTKMWHWDVIYNDVIKSS